MTDTPMTPDEVIEQAMRNEGLIDKDVRLMGRVVTDALAAAGYRVVPEDSSFAAQLVQEQWFRLKSDYDTAVIERDAALARLDELTGILSHTVKAHHAAEAEVARLRAAIGDPEQLRYHARGDVADTGAGDDLQALLRRIADAATPTATPDSDTRRVLDVGRRNGRFAVDQFLAATRTATPDPPQPKDPQ